MLGASTHTPKKRKRNQFAEWKREAYFPCALCRKLLLLTPFSLVLSALQLHFSADSMEVKPIMTRKLRRRPNDPVPIPDKRRKPAPDILSWSHCWLCSPCAAHTLAVLYSKEREMKCQDQISTRERNTIVMCAKAIPAVIQFYVYIYVRNPLVSQFNLSSIMR